MFDRSGNYCSADSPTWLATNTAHHYDAGNNGHIEGTWLLNWWNDTTVIDAYQHVANLPMCHTRKTNSNGVINQIQGLSWHAQHVGTEPSSYEYEYWGGHHLTGAHPGWAGVSYDVHCHDVVTIDVDSRLRSYNSMNYGEELCNLWEWGRVQPTESVGSGAHSIPRVHGGQGQHQAIVTHSNGGPGVASAFISRTSGGGCDKGNVYFLPSNPPFSGSGAANFVAFACPNMGSVAEVAAIAFAIQYPAWMPVILLVYLIADFILDTLNLGSMIIQSIRDGAYCQPNTLLNTSGGFQNSGGTWFDPNLPSSTWPCFFQLRAGTLLNGVTHPTDNANDFWKHKASGKYCGTSPKGMGIGSHLMLWGLSTVSYLEERWDNSCAIQGWPNYPSNCSWRGCDWNTWCAWRVGWTDYNDGMVDVASCEIGNTDSGNLIYQATNHEDGTLLNGDDWMTCGPVCKIASQLTRARWYSRMAWCSYYGYQVFPNNSDWLGPCPCHQHNLVGGGSTTGKYADGNSNLGAAAC